MVSQHNNFEEEPEEETDADDDNDNDDDDKNDNGNDCRLGNYKRKARRFRAK